MHVVSRVYTVLPMKFFEEWDVSLATNHLILVLFQEFLWIWAVVTILLELPRQKHAGYECFWFTIRYKHQ